MPVDGTCGTATGIVQFFRNSHTPHPLGWKLEVSASHCTHGAIHTLTGTFNVAPDGNGKYRQATGSGTLDGTDNVGNTPGARGDWTLRANGVMEY